MDLSVFLCGLVRQRVEDSLVAVLLSDGVLLQELIKSKGFTVCEVSCKSVFYAQTTDVHLSTQERCVSLV